ncbi:MAG: DUF6174 domain-containing protein [Pirellulales bacterium]
MRRSWRKRHPLALGLLVGLAGTALLGMAALLVNAALHRPTPLTQEAYEAAAARWDEHGPASYDLDVEIGGRRPGKVHVDVRDREVTHITRDGIEPRQRRTWYYWSVPGQLDTIELELEMAKDPATSYGATGASQVALWAEFDPEYGYPLQFDRIVLGADLEVHWKVTGFRPLAGK